MPKKLFLSLLIPVLIISTTALVIAFGRGYRFDINKKGVKTTGILVATSQPNGAQVFIDGQFSGATNSNINLEPGWYEVEIRKEGYQNWSKKLRIQGEVITQTNATLFPQNPSLSPLTTTGASQPLISPDGTKIAYLATPSAQMLKSFPELNNNLETPVVFIIDFSTGPLNLNRSPKPFAGSLDELSVEWEAESAQAYQRKLASLPLEFIAIASQAAEKLYFSPDAKKVLYQATSPATLPEIITPPLIGSNPTEQDREIVSGGVYVYDLKEDRNYRIAEAKVVNLTKGNDSKNLPLVSWLNTSNHLLLIEKSKISLIDYDGTNKKTVYSGPFENSYVFSHPTSLDLIILTTLNPDAASLPNLYSLSLR